MDFCKGVTEQVNKHFQSCLRPLYDVQRLRQDLGVDLRHDFYPLAIHRSEGKHESGGDMTEVTLAPRTSQ